MQNLLRNETRIAVGNPPNLPTMFKRTILGGCIASLALVLAACGGGSSGVGASSGSDPTVLRGLASKGPLNGATVCAYTVTSSGLKGAQIGTCATTDASGNYNIDLGGYTGAVLVQAENGTYVDEATGATVPLISPLHSALASATGGINNLALTALNELAYQSASVASGGLSTANIQAAVTTVQNNFGVSDIVSTMPADALNVPSSATVAQKTYALALATVSQYQKSQAAGTSLASALQTIQSCLAAPNTACGTGASSVNTLLNQSMFAFMADKPAFTGINLPVASLGTMKAATDRTALDYSKVVFAVLNTVPAGICVNGGNTLQTGIDTNGDGILAPAEVTITQYLCNGANGINGLTTLATVTSEPAGSHCPTGGQKISAGLDANRNGTLDC